MNSGLLVVLALFLIYLSATGKYTCVTPALKCLFQGAKICECSTQATAGAQQKPVGGASTGLEEAIRAGRDLYDRWKGIIQGAK